MIVTVCGTLLLICSCDKHHPGEYPEVQREKGAERKTTEAAAATTPAESATSSVTPTPAEFFPTKPR
jgi:hypothetical protein